MKAWIGKSIIIIGILHTLLGVIVFYGILQDLVRAHLFNTIALNQQPVREAVFWFLYTGFALIIVGGLVNWIERNDKGVPVFLSWSFLTIAATGIFIMPISGFWLLLIPTFGFFQLERRQRNKG